MRSAIHGGWVIVLAACGGGGASSAPHRAGTTTEPPQVVTLRAKRDALCACTDEKCVSRVLAGPLGREIEEPSIKDPATLRLQLGLGQDVVECLYRISGVPAACLAMLRTANALDICPALEDAQVDSLVEQVQGTTEAWKETAWRTLSTQEMGEYERACDDVAVTMRGLLPRECAPQGPAPGPK